MNKPKEIIIHRNPSTCVVYAYSVGTDDEKDVAARDIITRLISSKELTEPVVLRIPEFFKRYFSNYGEDYWDYMSDAEREELSDYENAVMNNGGTHPVVLENRLADYNMAKSISEAAIAWDIRWVRPQTSTIDEWRETVANHPELVEGMLVKDDGVYVEVSAWDVLHRLPQMGDSISHSILDAVDED